MKKIVGYCITVCLVLSMILSIMIPAFAKDEIVIWDGTMSEKFSGGTGTADDPYLISNGSDLRLLSYIFNNTPANYTGVDGNLKNEVIARSTPQVWSGGKTFKLTNDIYLNDTSKANWKESSPNVSETIGNRKGVSDGHRFLGTIDGAGYSIHGMYVTASNPDNVNSGVAFVGHLRGKIINLGIVDSYFGGSKRVAAFVGCLDASTALIDNCYTNAEIDATVGVVNTDFVGGEAGGFVGYLSGGTVSNCVFAGKINGVIKTGGIAGTTGNDACACNINSCLMLGSVTYDKEKDIEIHNAHTDWSELGEDELPFVGALVGNFSAQNGAQGLKDCYAIENSFVFNDVSYIVQPTMEQTTYLEIGKSETKYANYFDVTDENGKNIIDFVTADDIKDTAAGTTLKNFDFENHYSCIKDGTVCLTSFVSDDMVIVAPPAKTEDSKDTEDTEDTEDTGDTEKATEKVTEKVTETEKTVADTNEETTAKNDKGCKGNIGTTGVVIMLAVAGVAVIGIFAASQKRKES